MLMDGNAGGLTAADVGAVVGNRGGFGGFGGDGAWWLIILFLFVLSGNNGWGGFGNGGMMPWMMGTNTNNDVQRGFDQQALMTGITVLATLLLQALQMQSLADATVLLRSFRHSIPIRTLQQRA